MEMQDIPGSAESKREGDTVNPLRAAPAEGRPAPFSGNVSSLNEWFVRIAVPCGAVSKEDLEADTGQPQRRIQRSGGYKIIGFVEQAKRYQALMMSSWQEVWNGAAMANVSSLADDVPLLYLVLYFCFHRTTVRVTCVIAAYVTVVVLVGAALWGVTDQLLIQLIPSIVVFVCYPTMIRVTKGSLDAKTIRFDRSQLSLFSTRPKDDAPAAAASPIQADEPPSVTKALYRIYRLSKRYISDIFITRQNINNMTRQDRVWERKYRKSGIIGIDSYIELAENVSGYMKTVYSTDTEQAHGPAFTPRVYSTYLTLFGVVFCSMYGVFFVAYCWGLYIHNCKPFETEDVNNGNDEENENARWCNLKFFEIVFLLGHILSGCIQVVVTCGFFACMALFMYGIDLTIALMKFFVLRYQSMRQFSEENLKLDSCTASFDMLRAGIRRDAFERYLYIKHFVSESSRLWAPFLLISWLLDILLMVTSYSTIVHTYSQYGEIDAPSIIYFCVSALSAAYLLLLVAITNTAVDVISGAFVYSGLDDYALIGGRAEWVAYIAEAPLYWTILGFVITPAWVGAFATTIMSGVATMFILPFFS